MSNSFETESKKSPEMLEQEIDAKRASISNIVDSLESRFTPGQLFDQALAYTKGNGGEFFQNLGTTLKNNPVPTALTGLGLAWLAMNQHKPFHSGTTSTGTGLGEKISHAVDQVAGAISQGSERLHSSTDGAKAKAQSWKDKASDLTHNAGDTVGSATARMGDTARQASDQLSAQAGQLKDQLDHVMKEQPLILAAIGIALGAVLGAALPTTRKEDELMGKASDSAVDQVKATSQEAYSTAKEAVKGTAGSVKTDTLSKSGTSSATSASDLGTLPTGRPSPSSVAETGTDLSAGLGIKP